MDYPYYAGRRRQWVAEMRSESYPIVSIPTEFDARENRGARTKFWVRIEGGTDRWLLKIPRPNTGEHWAEKITPEIGRLIGIECAQVELAQCVDEAVFEHGLQEARDEAHVQRAAPVLLGTICKSFVPDTIATDTECYYFHGWQILQWVVESYDTRLRFGQRDHNIKNIMAALAHIMGINTLNPMPRWDDIFEHMASYVLLDGLVGNTDRHHENWMIACVHHYGDMWIEIMPSYDHASSLGRELTDEKRQHLLNSDGVHRYLNAGRGAVHVDHRRKRALSPLRLARLLCRWRPEFTRRALDRIGSVPEDEIRTTIQRVPAEFMSDVAKEFAFQVVMTGQRELLRSVR